MNFKRAIHKLTKKKARKAKRMLPDVESIFPASNVELESRREKKYENYEKQNWKSESFRRNQTRIGHFNQSSITGKSFFRSL